MQDGRIKVGNRWLNPLALSAFHLIHYERTGNGAEVDSQLDEAERNGINVVVVFDVTSFQFRIHPDQPGWKEARATVCKKARDRNLWVWLKGTDFGKLGMTQTELRAYVGEKAEFCLATDNVIPELLNEAYNEQFSGMSEVDDPDLLELAKIFRQKAPGVAFCISSPADGDDVDASAEMLERHKRIAALCDIHNQHNSRKEDPARWSREVDHMKGMIDIRALIGDNALLLIEPKGCASVRDVPIGGGKTYRRFGEEDSERIAAQLFVGMMIGGVCYHRIKEQDPGTPNIEACLVAAKIPCSPDFKFYNAGTGGNSPIGQFTGYEKVRCLSNGREAWVCGYGRDLQNATLEWRLGFQPEEPFQYRTPPQSDDERRERGECHLIRATRPT